MRRAAVLAVAAAMTFPGTTGATHAATPTLTLVDRSPVVLRGSGFGARERVTVVAASGVDRIVRRTVATTRGRFLVRFDALPSSRCTALSAVATGRAGHVALLKLGLRECPGPILDP